MRKQWIGVVKSDKNDKTRRVEVLREYRHPKYGKIVRSRIVCHVHDERNESSAGDRVEIAECRPMSKSKRWELLRVVQPAGMPSLDTASDPEPNLQPVPEPPVEEAAQAEEPGETSDVE